MVIFSVRKGRSGLARLKVFFVKILFSKVIFNVVPVEDMAVRAWRNFGAAFAIAKIEPKKLITLV